MDGTLNPISIYPIKTLDFCQQSNFGIKKKVGKQAALGHESGFRFTHTSPMKYSSCKIEQQGSRAKAKSKATLE
jgi:hypothetical protein